MQTGCNITSLFSFFILTGIMSAKEKKKEYYINSDNTFILHKDKWIIHI